MSSSRLRLREKHKFLNSPSLKSEVNKHFNYDFMKTPPIVTWLNFILDVLLANNSLSVAFSM